MLFRRAVEGRARCGLSIVSRKNVLNETGRPIQSPRLYLISHLQNDASLHMAALPKYMGQLSFP